MKHFYLLFQCIFFFNLGIWAQTATSPALGDGTEGNPYQIATLENLYWISQNEVSWDKYFIQTADIDAAGTSAWNGGEGWAPVGNNLNMFSGSYNGNGHSISGLTINRNGNFQGFFGYIDTTGKVTNLNLLSINFQVVIDFSGGLSAYNYGIIQNCSVAGSIVSTANAKAGGLAGHNLGTIDSCLAAVTVNSSPGSAAGLVNTNDGIISNSSASGETLSDEGNAGGLVYINNNQITNCSSAGNSSSWWAGNAAGFVTANYGHIEQCFSTGNAFAMDGSCGGFALNNYGTIANSYASGSAGCGMSTTAGLVYANYGMVNNCYSTGSVSSGMDTPNGLIAYNLGGTVIDSYWDINTSGTVSSKGGTGKTSAEMKKAGTFPNWEFASIWHIDETAGTPDNGGYPSLAWQGLAHNPTPVVKCLDATDIAAASFTANWQVFGDADGYFIDVASDMDFASYIPGFENIDVGNVSSLLVEGLPDGSYPCFYRVRGYNSVGTGSNSNAILVGVPYSGDGATNNPYLINNLDDLAFLSENPLIWDKHFLLTADIDALATSTWNGGEGFSPIGNSNFPFNGSFNGDNYEISNLYINRTSIDYQALFGFVGYSGLIQNTGLVSADITGNYNIAGLTAYSLGTVQKCYSSGSVEGKYTIGGLVGYNGGMVDSCYSSATVTTAQNTIGNLVGLNYGLVSNSYTNGVVNSIASGGGIAGVNRKTIENCYSTGTVSSPNNAGGICGSNYGTVSECFSTISISGGSSSTGGLFGYNDYNGRAVNCYATGNISGGNYVGGLIGMNRGYADNCYSNGLITGTSNRGGLIGWSLNAANVQNCYWDTQTSSQATSPGGGTGKTTTEMKTMATYLLWGFPETWHIDTRTVSPDNNGYPSLAWQQLAHCMPLVTTDEAKSITGNSAILGGVVNSEGYDAVTERGVLYSSSNESPEIDGAGVTKVAIGSGSGEFSQEITGLSAGTNYYVRAYATNSLGHGYGGILSFTTTRLSQTISFNPLPDKVYGDEDFTIIASASSGLTVSYSSSDINVASVSGNIITINGVGSTIITASQPGNELYLPAETVTDTLYVTAKMLTVSGLTAENKEYDGTTDAVLSGGTLEGIISGDDVTAGMPVSGSFADKNVGSAKAVSISAISLSGVDKDNYSLTQPTGLTAD
ncbi:MAG: hypothetical protein JXB34_14265, partial [Bacteroidales bacterium]|nr:hypothetical protein [Bacteroidales bacterium]